jgi:hypothetical protein
MCKAFSRADDGTRTHDTWLGKPVLYRLSYVREARILAALRLLLSSGGFGRRHFYANSCPPEGVVEPGVEQSHKSRVGRPSTIRWASSQLP